MVSSRRRRGMLDVMGFSGTALLQRLPLCSTGSSPQPTFQLQKTVTVFSFLALLIKMKRRIYPEVFRVKRNGNSSPVVQWAGGSPGPTSRDPTSQSSYTVFVVRRCAGLWVDEQT